MFRAHCFHFYMRWSHHSLHTLLKMNRQKCARFSVNIIHSRIHSLLSMKDEEMNILGVTTVFSESENCLISTLSCRPVLHTCSLEFDKESATSRSKSLSSSTNTSAKTYLSVWHRLLLMMLEKCVKYEEIQ